MERGEINKVLMEMEAFIKKYRFVLPPFCHFTLEDRKSKGRDYDRIHDDMLGWDITGYGLGDLDKVGLSLITVCNGNFTMKDEYAKTYAEKLPYLREDQYAPIYFHWSRMEDIINRDGGNVLIRIYNSTPGEGLDEIGEVHVHTDGWELTVPAGTQVRLMSGESVTVQPYLYHDFSVEEGTRPVLLGKVSQYNDDNTGNRSLKPIGRFPAIEGGEPSYRLLCNEYPEPQDRGKDQ